MIISIAVGLFLVTSVASTDSANAYKYKKTQVAYQSNYCGNGDLPLNVFCQNIFTQLQGDGNAMNIIALQP